GSAMTMGIPIVQGICSASGATADEVLAQVPAPTPAVVDWVTRMAPLHPFRMWPIGLSDFLAPILAANPFASAMRTVEVLDECAWGGAGHGVICAAGGAEAEGGRRAASAAAVHKLPSAADVVDRYLGGPCPAVPVYRYCFRKLFTAASSEPLNSTP